jgi:hypothetical protein
MLIQFRKAARRVRKHQAQRQLERAVPNDRNNSADEDPSSASLGDKLNQLLLIAPDLAPMFGRLIPRLLASVEAANDRLADWDPSFDPGSEVR